MPWSLITFNLPCKSVGVRGWGNGVKGTGGRSLSKRGPLSVHDRPLIRIIRFRPTLGATFIRRSCVRKIAPIAGGPGIYEHRGHMLVETLFFFSFLFPSCFHVLAFPVCKKYLHEIKGKELDSGRDT